MDSAQDLPKGRGFPIRTSADQRSLASPRGFSQRATSFIASRRQGIHRTPLSCSGQKTRPTTQQQPNQPTPLETKPNAAATDAHRCRRFKADGRWANNGPANKRRHRSRKHIQSRFNCERTSRRRRHPGENPPGGGGGEGFRRQASRQPPAAPGHPRACACARGPGGDRVRTDDPLLAKQVLSQLSYAPAARFQAGRRTDQLASRLAGWHGPGRT